MSSLFKSFKNFFSRSVEESVEESLDEFLEPADTSVSPSELRDVPYLLRYQMRWGTQSMRLEPLVMTREEKSNT